MNIWLDLANSPQVLVFKPILDLLAADGHEVAITTRAYAQTVQLADRFGLPHTCIGAHGGRGLRGLASSNAGRTMQLALWARGRKFDLAVSHNSYSQLAAARLLGILAVTLMDYEHQPLNHLAFRLARRVIVPEAFPPERIRAFGAARRAVTYPGVKEEIYLSGFRPDPGALTASGLPEDRPVVVVRPPAPWTAYHRFENDVFDELLAYVASLPGIHVLFIPRLAEQADSVRHLPGVHVATRVIDGPQVLYHAAAVISGGGTMNREAAVLGTPTFTVFKGKLGAVDNYLIERGRMRQITSPADFNRIAASLREARQAPLTGASLVRQLTTQILETV